HGWTPAHPPARTPCPPGSFPPPPLSPPYPFTDRANKKWAEAHLAREPRPPRYTKPMKFNRFSGFGQRPLAIQAISGQLESIVEARAMELLFDRAIDRRHVPVLRSGRAGSSGVVPCRRSLPHDLQAVECPCGHGDVLPAHGLEDDGRLA